MKSWKTPTPDQVKKAVALLAHPQQVRHFFERLENPLWVRPLRELGCFSNPPEPIEDKSAGTVQFPSWPPSRYLARVSGEPTASDAAIEIALTLVQTRNITVQEDLVQVALSAPAVQAKRLVPAFTKWLPSPYRMLLPKKLGELLSHLARGGESEAALTLAEALLKIVPDRAMGDLVREGRPAIDPWQFGQILERNVPDLVRATQLQALDLLCERLGDAVRLTRTRGQDDKEAEDYSEIWRPSLESERFPERALDALVSAVRDAASVIVKQDSSLLNACVELLLRHRWLIFKRLALHLAASQIDSGGAMVASLLLDKGNLRRFSAEYSVLLRTGFGRLALEQQLQVLEWIDAGPDIDRWKAGQESLRGEVIADAEAASWARRWRYERLSVVADWLPPASKKQLQELTAEFGPPRASENHASAGIGVGPTSPRTEAELGEMGPDATVAFMGRWKPTPDALGSSPSPEGLARVLTEVVARDAAAYSLRAASFRDLDPTYARALLAGLSKAARDGKPIVWREVLPLIAWILDQPVAPVESRFDDRDPGWQWTRTEIARLLDSAFNEKSGLPFELRNSAWEVVSRLAEDPHPTPEHEAEYGGTNMDPVTLSINTTRGEALHAAMRYMLWTRNSLLSSLAGTVPEPRVSFAQMPEVQTLLERHLDAASDPSLAIRSVYGKWFPWLVLTDPKWASANAWRIFPIEIENEALWAAAWDAYVVFNQPFDDVLTVMQETYRHAIGQLRHPTAENRKRYVSDPAHNLAEHLVLFYGRGKLDLAEGGLIRSFFESAGPTIRKHAIWFIGNSLAQPSLSLPREVLERFSALWNWRLTMVQAADVTVRPGLVGELAGFSSWFSAGVFPDEWALAQLLEITTLGVTLEHADVVIERLAITAKVYPLQSVHALAAVVRSDKEGWVLMGLETEPMEVLRTALKSSSEDARSAAMALIHELGSRGMFGFRQLLETE